MTRYAMMFAVAAASAGLVWACGGTLSERPTTKERLADTPTFDLVPETGLVSVLVRVNRGDHWSEHPFELGVSGGEVVAALDGDALAVHALAIDVTDVVVAPSEGLPDGLWFTGLRLVSAEPTACDATVWSDDDDTCTAELPARLTLEWALVVDGDPVALGPQTFDVMRLPVSATRDTKGYSLTLAGDVPGVMWEWAGLVEFSQLSLYVRGVAP